MSVYCSRGGTCAFLSPEEVASESLLGTLTPADDPYQHAGLTLLAPGKSC